MKKLVSLLLAVAIIASMAVSAFAVVPIVEEKKEETVVKKEEPKKEEPKKEETKKEETKVVEPVVEEKKSGAGVAVCIGVFVAGCIVGAVVMHNVKKNKKNETK